MADLDLDAIKARCGSASRGPGDAKAFIAHAREDIPALVAEVERLRRALRSIAYTDHMTGPAVRFARSALDPEMETSEPRCELCGYVQHVRHHRSETAKGYHPFVSHDRG